MSSLERILKKTRIPYWAAGVLILMVVVAVVGARAYLTFYPHPVPMEGRMIEFVPLGDVDQALVEFIAEETARVYGVPHRVTPRQQLPAFAFDAEREQYRAEEILDYAGDRSVREGVHQLIVMDADLTAEDLNFVFGYGQQPGTTAVMSLTRLRPKGDREDANALLRERAVKIAVHEIGHTLGFRHCPDERCVMAYSDTAAGVDQSAKTFCEQCAQRLQ